MDKKQNINSSSIIDLKAELFRKQEEFKQQKLDNQDVGYVKGKTSLKQKSSIWSKHNKGVLDRASRDFEEKVEAGNEIEKSKKCLEAKAKLYDKITKGKEIPDEDGSKIFLVDFEKKAIDRIVEEREKKRKEEEEELEREEEELLKHAVVPPPANESEEWVDYVDGFGRSRRCMKKDLPHLLQQDKKIHDNSSESSIIEDKRSAEMVSNDMYKEMLRQKWEEEERAAMNQPIHYSNVQYDEIRTHGVGFYQFSKDELSRQEQLDSLKDIRDKTKEARGRNERIKEKRKAIMEARLAKVKQRKMKREGITEPVEDSTEDEKDDVGPKLEEAILDQTPTEKTIEKQEPELLARDESIRNRGSQREWDKGKERLFPVTSEDRYLDDRRSERIAEFAPPSMYFDQSKKNSQWNSQKVQSSSAAVAADQNDAKTNKKVTMKDLEHLIEEEKLKSQRNTESDNQTSTDTSQIGSNISDIPLPSHKTDVKSQHPTYTGHNGENVMAFPPPGFQGNFVSPPRPPLFMLQPPSETISGYQCSLNQGSFVQNHPSIPQQTQILPENFAVYSNPQPSVGNIPWNTPVTSGIQWNMHTTSITTTANESSETCQASIIQNSKPTRYNIVDPRLIQNEEVLESTPQNFTPIQDNSGST